jgi:hypothetical protein
VSHLIGSGVYPRLVELLALALGVLAVVVLRRWPRLALVSYLVALAFVPVWAVTGPLGLEPQVLWGLVTLAAALPLVARRPLRPVVADGLVALFLLSSVVPLAAGRASLTSLVVVAVQWIGAYLVGRTIADRTGYDWCLRAIAVVFTVVGLLAVVEFLSGWNPFVLVPGSGTRHATWATLQERGGVIRAEGAFGHSIALGAALSMAVPLTIGSSFRLGVRVLMVVVMVGGVVVTFSRIGLITAVLGIVLSIVALREEMTRRLRVVLAVAVAVVGLAVLPLLSRVFVAAGDEATKSAAYRSDLISLVGEMRALGFSSALYRSPTGEVYFGSFRSIDSALILQGLTYGWVSLVFALLLLASGAVAVVTMRASAPTIALVGQVPAFATVALITQYSTMVWFVAGLAVFAQALRRPEVVAHRVDAPDPVSLEQVSAPVTCAYPGRPPG